MPPLRVFKSNCHWRPNQMRASTCCLNTTFIAQPVATHMIILDLKAITTVKAPHMYNSLLWQNVVWQEQASSACVIAAPADKSQLRPCSSIAALALHWQGPAESPSLWRTWLGVHNWRMTTTFVQSFSFTFGRQDLVWWPTCILLFLQPKSSRAF